MFVIQDKNQDVVEMSVDRDQIEHSSSRVEVGWTASGKIWVGQKFWFISCNGEVFTFDPIRKRVEKRIVVMT
jgi:hypothetical protein